MPTHISFPDIGQFRNVIRAVQDKTRYVGKDSNGDAIYDPLKPLPVLNYTGFVKLHGSNGCIAFDPKTGEFWLQTRERICTVENDNAGFARFFTDLFNNNNGYHINGFLDKLFNSFINESRETIFIYGEWCGKGIQKNVAIADLPKMFVIFNVRVGGNWLPREKWKDIKFPEYNIYNIQDYKTYHLTIDFNRPELIQNDIVKIVEEVEKECPVGKAFGVSGIGEGLVWTPDDFEYQDGRFWMKTKGEKHSISRVKTLVPVDIEKVNSINDFISKVVTDNRCQQSITKLREANKPLDRTSMGEFIRWIYNDIVKEESDTAKESNIELNKIGGEVAKAAKTWFFKNEGNLENL